MVMILEHSIKSCDELTVEVCGSNKHYRLSIALRLVPWLRPKGPRPDPTLSTCKVVTLDFDNNLCYRGVDRAPWE